MSPNLILIKNWEKWAKITYFIRFLIYFVFFKAKFLHLRFKNSAFSQNWITLNAKHAYGIFLRNGGSIRYKYLQFLSQLEIWPHYLLWYNNRVTLRSSVEAIWSMWLDKQQVELLDVSSFLFFRKCSILHKIQWNSVITNGSGPAIFVRNTSLSVYIINTVAWKPSKIIALCVRQMLLLNLKH